MATEHVYSQGFICAFPPLNFCLVLFIFLTSTNIGYRLKPFESTCLYIFFLYRISRFRSQRRAEERENRRTEKERKAFAGETLAESWRVEEDLFAGSGETGCFRSSQAQFGSIHSFFLGLLRVLFSYSVGDHWKNAKGISSEQWREASSSQKAYRYSIQIGWQYATQWGGRHISLFVYLFMIL